jgi:hypothetical protein
MSSFRVFLPDEPNALRLNTFTTSFIVFSTGTLNFIFAYPGDTQIPGIGF